MSHSCIISKAKSALEVSEAAAKLADRHVKKILTEDLEAVVAGGRGEEGAGMMRDLMLRQDPFTSIRGERTSPDLSTSLSSVYYWISMLTKSIPLILMSSFSESRVRE